MKCSGSKYLKDIIFGSPDQSNYDGIHMRGKSAIRHFTYRAVQAVKLVLGGAKNDTDAARDNLTVCGFNCPQQKYQRQARANQKPDNSTQQRKHYQQTNYGGSGWQSDTRYTKTKTYAEAVNGKQKDDYNVPTFNFWNPDNCRIYEQADYSCTYNSVINTSISLSDIQQLDGNESVKSVNTADQQGHSSDVNQIPVVISNRQQKEYLPVNIKPVRKTLKRNNVIVQSKELPVVMNINPSSIYNKCKLFSVLVEQYEADVICMSESWDREN